MPVCDTLRLERGKVPLVTFEALSAWWVGGTENLKNRRRIAAAFEHDEDFLELGPIDDIYRLSKKERYHRAGQRFNVALQKVATGATQRSPYSMTSQEELSYFLFLAVGPELPTNSIQVAMFIPTLRNQTSQEQRDAWLPAAKTMAILGCYAQTEIAHGSDVRSLQTEARFDPATRTFDLHTPNVGATKWWPAALGRTATHAIVHARLLLPTASGYADHGVKPFFVQLRDLDTHKNLPGIESGDIGPTMGVVSIEEGWCRFNNVKLPHIALLARYGHVSTTGSWVPPPPRFSKRAYATMLLMRSRMVVITSEHLGIAATIAVRYCAVRRQFKRAGSSQETQARDLV